MDIITLSGLLGLGYVVSKLGRNNKITPSELSNEINNGNINKLPPHNHVLPPSDHSYPLLREGFIPAQRGPNSDPLTNAPKGTSATGFAPELDMMYKVSNGQTYPSEPSSGPYGNAFGYSSNKPPLAPKYNSSGPKPVQQPIDSNIPMVEYRSDGIEEDSNYIDSDYVVSQLSGKQIPSSEFKHNNMQPFYGGRMKQNIAPTSNTGILDMFNGNGSTQLKKREVENMFSNERAPFGNPLGMEDNTEFFQSRIESQAPKVRNGERPFEPVKVGSGIGEKFGLNGKGGFQQLEINEIMRPKDTNDLRVLSKPKETYLQPVIPGQHYIGKSSESNDIGEVRKYKPDTFYIDETGERFFTTTGDLIKDSIRPVQLLPHTTRPETSKEYSGIASSQDFSESYVSGSYRLPMGQQYSGAGYRNADMTGYYTRDVGQDHTDYGKSSIEIRPNERNETSERVMALNAVPAENGMVSTHFTDNARPTRRSETVGNIRMTGTPTLYTDKAPAITVWDSHDVARTTVKESTIYLDRPGIVSGNDGISAPTRLKVYDPEDIARTTQKSQLSANLSWTGPSGNGAWSDAMDNTFAYNMRTNPNKELIAKGRKPIAGSGKTATFNGNPGKQASKKLDADILNDRPLAINRSLDISPGVGDLGRMEYRVPLNLDVNRQRNTLESISALDSNPYHQSIQKNASIDAQNINEYRSYLSSQNL
jgi:hypothetical protein